MIQRDYKSAFFSSFHRPFAAGWMLVTALCAPSLPTSGSSLSPESAGLFVDPLRVEIIAPPGASYEDRISLRNEGVTPLRVSVDLLDATPLGDGIPWIEADVGMITLQPGEQHDKTYRLILPHDASGELRARIVFSKDEEADRSGAVQMVGRLAVPIYVGIRGTEIRKAEITGIHPCPRQSNRMEVEVFNHGNVHIRPQGILRVLDGTGTKTLTEVSVNEWGYPILPGTTDSLGTAELDRSSLPLDGLYEAVLTFEGITISHRQSVSFEP